MRRRTRRVAFFVFFGVLVPLAACGTGALDIDYCRQVENARCTAAARLCNTGTDKVDFMAPFADASSCSSLQCQQENATACMQFYSIACLHGLRTTQAPNATGQDSVKTCVEYIGDATTCSEILYPQGQTVDGAPADGAPANPPCAWLIPVPEAGPEAAAEAGTDAPADVPIVTYYDAPAFPPDVVRGFSDAGPDCQSVGCMGSGADPLPPPAP